MNLRLVVGDLLLSKLKSASSDFLQLSFFFFLNNSELVKVFNKDHTTYQLHTAMSAQQFHMLVIGQELYIASL